MGKQQLREYMDAVKKEGVLIEGSLLVPANVLSELLEAAERASVLVNANHIAHDWKKRAEAAEAQRDRLAGALRKIVDSFYFLEDHIHQDCVICRPAYEHRHEEDCPILAAERLVAAEALKEAENGKV